MSSSPAVHRWIGRGASGGTAHGPARVLRRPEDIAACGPGEVVVMRHPTPRAATAAVGAAALVCETGGVLNHLAVLARELGLPCVTSLPGIVESVDPGTELRVDGTRGFVDGPAPVRVVPAPTQGTVPLLRFGRYSATFDCEEAVLSPEAFLRLAALVRLPVRMGLGDPLEVTFEGNQVLAERADLRSLADRLASLLEAGSPSAAALRSAFDEDSGWHGWACVPLPEDAIARYVRLNHVTWVASLAKEELAARLLDRTGDADVFLRSLGTSGVSYLRPGPRTAPDPQGAAVCDLVEITERKNTDLARTTALMGRLPLAAALGVPSLEDDGTDAGRRRRLRQVSDALAELTR